MNDLSELLGITTLDIVRWCVIAVIVVGVLIAGGTKIHRMFKKTLQKYSTDEETMKKRVLMLNNHEESIAELKQTDEVILGTLQEIQESLEEMRIRQAIIEKAEKKADINNLKDRIGQIYRYCHAKKEITEIQKTALLGLIENVEELGEHNSFVHEIVQPEIEMWEVIDD